MPTKTKSWSRRTGRRTAWNKTRKHGKATRRTTRKTSRWSKSKTTKTPRRTTAKTWAKKAWGKTTRVWWTTPRRKAA